MAKQAIIDFNKVPDSVWLEILSYLSSDHLLLWTNLTEIELKECQFYRRLFHLCGDKSLWRTLNWEGGSCKPIILRKIVRFIGPYTTKIRLSGGNNLKKKLKIPESLLHSIQTRATKLEILQLENCSLDYYETPLRKLPKTVEKITLNSVSWTNLPFFRNLQASPFFKLKKRLPELKEIRIEGDAKWLGKQDRNCLKLINNGCVT